MTWRGEAAGPAFWRGVVTGAVWLGVAAGLPALASAQPGDAATSPDAGHVAEHDRTAVLEEEAEREWMRMTPSERDQRAQAAVRAADTTSPTGEAPLDQVGRWGPLMPLDEYAIHASLLPTGKVLIFGRQPKGPDGTRENVGRALLFDPNRPEEEPNWVNPPPVEDTNG